MKLWLHLILPGLLFYSGSTLADELPCPRHGNIQQCLNEKLGAISQKLDAALQRLQDEEGSNAGTNGADASPAGNNEPATETTGYFDKACAQYVGTLMSHSEASVGKKDLDSWEAICGHNPNVSICTTAKTIIQEARGETSLTCGQRGGEEWPDKR